MTQNKFLTHALAAAAVLAASGAVHAQVTNGSFEDPLVTYQATPPAGWTGSAEHFNPFAYDPDLGAAQDGVMVVDLAWASGGSIAQQLATSVGQQYQVSFWMGNSNYVGRAGASQIDVSVDGYNGSFNIGAATQTAIAWQPMSFLFTATTATPTLTFSNSQDQLQVFAFMDNVTVTAVPEPSAYVLALVGLGMLGFMARRRQGS